MADEATTELPAAEAVPELPATTAEQPEIQQSEDAEAAEPKSFTQEEMDAAIQKRLAREQRKWERDQQSKATANPPAQAPANPDEEEYVPKSEVDRRAREIASQTAAQREETVLRDTYFDREEAVREEYDDFQQVAYNPNVPISDVMARAMMLSELGPKVLYHLGSNPSEAQRISRLAPLAQATEIGKIEAKIAADPPAKRTTAAPPPISPVTPRSTNAAAYDTTDPRSIKSMSTSEWIEADRKRLAKQWEAKRSSR